VIVIVIGFRCRGSFRLCDFVECDSFALEHLLAMLLLLLLPVKHG
jgi:hypothetical protein